MFTLSSPCCKQRGAEPGSCHHLLLHPLLHFGTGCPDHPQSGIGGCRSPASNSPSPAHGWSFQKVCVGGRSLRIARQQLFCLIYWLLQRPVQM